MTTIIFIAFRTKFAITRDPEVYTKRGPHLGKRSTLRSLIGGGTLRATSRFSGRGHDRSAAASASRHEPSAARRRGRHACARNAAAFPFRSVPCSSFGPQRYIRNTSRRAFTASPPNLFFYFILGVKIL